MGRSRGNAHRVAGAGPHLLVADLHDQNAFQHQPGLVVLVVHVQRRDGPGLTGPVLDHDLVGVDQRGDPVARRDAAPAAAVALPPLLALRAEPLPAAMLDRDRGAVAVRHERDLDLGGVAAVEAQVPEVDEPVRRLPGEHFAPVVLDALRRALVDAPARLEDHAQPRLAGDRVPVRPPAARLLRPQRERPLGRARHRELEPQGIHQLSARSLKRAAASPHTCSR